MRHAGAFVAFPATQKAAVVEHVLGQWVQCPEITFARVTRLTRNFDEAIVQAEIVTNGILPCGELLFVVRKSGKCNSDVDGFVRKFVNRKKKT